MTRPGALEVLSDPAEVAAAAADAFVSAGRASSPGTFHVALAGGSTPRATYALLAEEARAREIDWSGVEVWFGDERCVPPDHSDSNYRMAKEALFDHVPLSAEHIHRISGEAPPDEAASAYEARLRERFAVVPPALPRFNLLLLGMGPDGHTASLFPGTTALSERERLVTSVYIEKLGTYRVTLTLPLLCAAKRILITAVGAEKAEALALALDGPPFAVPVASIRPTNGSLTWLVDRAAASRV